MSSDAGSLGGGSTGTTGSGAITYSSGADANAMSMEALAATPWAQLWVSFHYDNCIISKYQYKKVNLKIIESRYLIYGI
jgi:hypothetical protein